VPVLQQPHAAGEPGDARADDRDVHGERVKRTATRGGFRWRPW
jgi:hypothetical protein